MVKNNGANFHHSQDGHLHQPSGSPDFPFDFDTPPYQLVQQYPEVGVEERHYKSQNWVCTRAEVDTAADPLAGLEAFPPQELLRSDRYQEGPQGTITEGSRTTHRDKTRRVKLWQKLALSPSVIGSKKEQMEEILRFKKCASTFNINIRIITRPIKKVRKSPSLRIPKCTSLQCRK